MKPLFIIILFYHITLQLAAQVEKKHINKDEIPLKSYAEAFYKRYNIQIFYPDSFCNILVNNHLSDSIEPESALKIDLSGTNLRFSMWNGGYILLENKTIDLPILKTETFISKQDSILKIEKNITNAELQYLNGRRPGDLQEFIIGNFRKMNETSIAKIRIKLTDKDNGEALVGATLYFESLKSGTVSDQNGLIVYLVKPDKYKVRFNCMGYEPLHCNICIYSDGETIVEMERSVITLKEVIISGDRNNEITTRNAGMEKISVKTIRELPTMAGEKDIIRISELLPGIVSTGEGSQGLNVRGGNSDQNMFYINQVPIYNTSHLFGFYPAFNQDIIKDFSIYKGHIPAEFGGRLSSVFNIISRQGNRKKIGLKGGVSPIATNVTFEFPIIKDTCSILVSARTSYSDWLLTKINDPRIRKSSAAFYDICSSFSYDINAANQISLFFYRSYDNFKLADINSYNNINNGLSINWMKKINTTIHGNLTVIYSGYQFATINQQEKISAYQHQYQLNHYELKSNLAISISNRNHIETGFGSIIYNLYRGKIQPKGELSQLLPVNLGEENAIENYLYAHDNYEITNNLNLSAGIRFTAYSLLGPYTHYRYLSQLPREIPYISEQ